MSIALTKYFNQIKLSINNPSVQLCIRKVGVISRIKETIVAKGKPDYKTHT